MSFSIEKQSTTDLTPSTSTWSAVIVMSLCCAVLIASEFMPVSLLTPIASDLKMTEGLVGQAIAISGIFAVITSLTISKFTRKWDRRSVLLGLTFLMILSRVIITFAYNSILFMLGRAILGIVIGVFWSMSTAIVMRLVRFNDVSKPLGLLNGGNALATTIGHVQALDQYMLLEPETHAKIQFAQWIGTMYNQLNQSQKELCL